MEEAQIVGQASFPFLASLETSPKLWSVLENRNGNVHLVNRGRLPFVPGTDWRGGLGKGPLKHLLHRLADLPPEMLPHEDVEKRIDAAVGISQGNGHTVPPQQGLVKGGLGGSQEEKHASDVEGSPAEEESGHHQQDQLQGPPARPHKELCEHLSGNQSVASGHDRKRQQEAKHGSGDGDGHKDAGRLGFREIIGRLVLELGNAGCR